MFTRFRDDDARIQHQVDGAAFAGKYALEAPGQGLDLPFLADPNVRMQRWGANLVAGVTDVESDFRGLTRPLNRDLPAVNGHRDHATRAYITLPTREEDPFVQESRATHPAWSYRVVAPDRWERPFINPQANVEIPFLANIHSRVLVKDDHAATN
jgi:hypothetical protein